LLYSFNPDLGSLLTNIVCSVSHGTRKTVDFKFFLLQVLEFLEEMSEQLTDVANRELSILKDLKVLRKLLYALLNFPWIKLFSLINQIVVFDFLISD
jgi:hypothetical protein